MNAQNVLKTHYSTNHVQYGENRWRGELVPDAGSDMADLNHNMDSTGEADKSWVSAELGFREIHLWVLSHEPADTQES